MKIKKISVTMCILIIVYIYFVFYFTIISRESSDEHKLELLPFKTVIEFLNVDYDSHGQYILREVLLNIGLLMPVGFLLVSPLASFRIGAILHKVIILGFSISLIIETFQLITTKTGTFEVDDLIYNTLGCAIGYLILQKYINITC